jgi:hypothetical protein
VRCVILGTAACLASVGCPSPPPPVVVDSLSGFRPDGADDYLCYVTYRAIGPVTYDYAVVTYGRLIGLQAAGDRRVIADGNEVRVPAEPGVFIFGADRAIYLLLLTTDEFRQLIAVTKPDEFQASALWKDKLKPQLIQHRWKGQ